MLTLNAVDASGEKAAPLHELLRSMPAKDPAATGRANGYVARLQEGFRKPGDAPQTPEKDWLRGPAGRNRPPRAKQRSRTAAPVANGERISPPLI